MRIDIFRTGGFAGITRHWAVESSGEDEEYWSRLVLACPWGEAGPEEAQPDRYMYTISAGHHRAVLGEQFLTGPWKQLLQQAQQADADRLREDSDGNGRA